ncbi:glycosyltransferase family 2 protein [Sporomusa sp. KB1]|jgi:dolichol-phosphate mannosyltransferase|uniref:glycosyltransferase family 2 protein n=1 Tax=Sporomusa sp. KB1 TaxID=943346 RepID=UPI0011A5734F|nr:glycosyltransferase family 2 protein [Sporomusa sp. KB1]TWH48278.1 dolichol-phosphate mannosyltransferase [Sporomusa sp. KB1]
MGVINTLISIVVPVYNEQENIDNFYSEVVKHMEQLAYCFEIIFVDDGSSDATPLILERLATGDKRVRALIMARNFGHQVALTCGLDHAQGDAIITMDGDMQHPPEMVPLLISKWEEGFQVVQTVRINTEGVSWFKNFTSGMFYKLMNALSNVQVAEGGSDFRLLDKQVVDSFRRFRERARFIRGMISAIGYRQTNIEFIAPKRFAGQSKFSLKKMLHFALDGITAYSKTPLRFAFYIGILLGSVSIGLTLHVLYIKIFTTEAVPGWATITASILLLGGLQLAGIGIIGEYVGRIFEEVKQRPLYWLRAELGQQVTKDKQATFGEKES